MTWEGLGCVQVLGSQVVGLAGSSSHLGGADENYGGENKVRCKD